MTTSTRFALFGDSYISRLAKFCDNDLKIPGDVRFYGKGGMTIAHYDTALLHQLIAFEPNVVLLNIGGNDINSTSTPSLIHDEISSLCKFLKEIGVTTVYVVKISERGLFIKDRETTRRSFNAQRRKINTLLEHNQEVTTVDLKMNFPKDCDEDQVHFSSSVGLKKCFFNVRRVLLQHKCS